MFKFESYITPMILSYVDKYIKNFRPEDSQVSLWGGDATFHNLDLRLEVLEKELQLPFSFVSGHIHELLIHVPWTKLASEPITITINTIECILKLKDSESPGSSNRARSRHHIRKRHTAEEQPPSYVNHLMNKIVNNIKVNCNNLILKYVEEDIVLSMNVKLLTFESASEKWEPAFTEGSPVIMRKLITINDLTACLDKRNAAGMIEVYQEPMLYRCSMVIHLMRTFRITDNKRYSITRMDLSCNNMEFSMTEQQIPMLLRLLYLLHALHQKQLKSDTDLSVNNEASSQEPSEDVLQDEDDEDAPKQSLANWAWSFVPSFFPLDDEEKVEDECHSVVVGDTTHFGFYVDFATITFKLSETNAEKSSYYGQKKLKYWPLLTMKLDGIFSETMVHGRRWCQASMGISKMVLLPLGCCSCSIQDVVEGDQYLSAGSRTDFHKSDSLFDANTPENFSDVRQYNMCWERHLDSTTEAALLERSPALAFDYVYQLNIPEDGVDNLSEIGSDLEFSNFEERALIRIVFGPMRLRVCSGLVHRFSSLQAAAGAYDYIPYSIPKADPELGDLPPPTTEDFDGLNETIPERVMQFTILAPVVTIELMDHPFFEATKEILFIKRKKVSSVMLGSPQHPKLPSVMIDFQCLDYRMTAPMYPKRLAKMVCQLPDPPKQMYEACHEDIVFKVIDCQAKLVVLDTSSTILTPCSVNIHQRKILAPNYWVNPNTAHRNFLFETDGVTVNCTNPKFVLVAQIVDKLLKRDAEDAINYMTSSSIQQDALHHDELSYLELSIEAVRFRIIETISTMTIDAKLGAIKAFIFEPKTEPRVEDPIAASVSYLDNFEQVLILSAPEVKDEYKNFSAVSSEPLLRLTCQFPLSPDTQAHPALLIFNVRDVRVCFDPMLCRWLLYTPKNLSTKTEVLFDSTTRKVSRSYSEANVLETPRRNRSSFESVHSSTEQILEVPKMLSLKEDDSEEDEKTYHFLKKWFDVWKGLVLYGNISQCTIYCPVMSLSSVGAQGVQHTIDEAMKDPNPQDILILALPSVTIRNSQYRENLSHYVKELPVNLPEHLWTKDKSSFPWNISIVNLYCYTWQNGEKINCLAPVNFTSTVGMSTKSTCLDVEIPRSPKPDTHINVDNLHNVSNKSDITTLGVCVHNDISPIVISISELQVCLIASILHGLTMIIHNVRPAPAVELVRTETVPILAPQTSTLSPTLMKESIESFSEKNTSTQIEDMDMDPDDVKLTAWIQCTIAKFTVELLAHNSRDLKAKEFKHMRKPKLKFVIDAEDIVSSLDFQKVFMKLKAKVGSASVMHYVLKEKKWEPGEFLGVVMRVNEDTIHSIRQEDTSFANITLTRASSKHTHTLWGASKQQKITTKGATIQETHLRYMTEVLVNLQPIDILLSPTTLKNYILVLEPLFRMPDMPMSATKKEPEVALQVHNHNLPLIYVEFHGFRLIVPSVDLHKQDMTHNVAVFQIKRINLSPTVANPICRTPFRPDIYQQAEKARIINIPGSDVEDRQYQLDIMEISINTGSWNEISRVLTHNRYGKTKPMLRTMIENPALEWNTDKGNMRGNPENAFWQLMSKFDICIVAAPAMIYKKDVICGHSVEVNFISDIKLTMSLDQINLLMALSKESSYAFELLGASTAVKKRPKIIFPYPKFKVAKRKISRQELEIIDVTKDSGIEASSDYQSTSFSSRTRDGGVGKRSNMSDKSIGAQSFAKTMIISTQSYVPLDFLVTAGKVSLALYEYDDHLRNTCTALRLFKKGFESESEQGYDASEEGSSDERPTGTRFYPLVYMSVAQPNAFLTDTLIGRRVQFSCFDVSLKISKKDGRILKNLPGENDFNVKLIETRMGQPNPDTGVLPAFFTVKWSQGIGNASNLELTVAKPTRFICSSSRWHQVMHIKKRFYDNFKPHFHSTPRDDHGMRITNLSESPSQASVKNSDYYIKFKEIRERLFGVTKLDISIAQVVLCIQTSRNVELNLSIAKFTHHTNVLMRPEKVHGTIDIDAITIGLLRGQKNNIILTPFCVHADTTLYWESWQHANANPQIQIVSNIDRITFEVSPDKVQCVDAVMAEYTDFMKSFPANKHRPHSFSMDSKPKTTFGDKEQHYKDDLKAGAFQFVDSPNNSEEDMPMPYQVMFWTKVICAMAWRYPQPRALTKVRVFPAPFKTDQEDHEVLCHLQYWSDCHAGFQPYSEFYLSETEIYQLELPKDFPEPIVSCIWRVLLTFPTANEYCERPVRISPKALPGCLRIDSYFNKNLIPDINLVLHVDLFSITLYNYLDKESEIGMPEDLKNYTPELIMPEYQQFFSLSISNFRTHMATWNFDKVAFDISSIKHVTVLDYRFLTHQSLVEPFYSKLRISFSKSLGVQYISKPIQVNIGASAAHTLAVSAQMWSEYLRNGPVELIVMTQYVICNDTNATLRFGQAGCELLQLAPRRCHFYAWRSLKAKKVMRVGFLDPNTCWSEPFDMGVDGTVMCKLNDNSDGMLVITVKSLSATQKQIIFAGQLVLCNTLAEHVEMKIFQPIKNQDERDFRNVYSNVVSSKIVPPSVLIDASDGTYYLRVRFFGLESAWSGDIPLMENVRCAQPWLVKVPLQERGQFLSIWCKIVAQKFRHGVRMLVVLFPLFMIRSNLPITANVHVETPTLHLHLDSTVAGHGGYEQLYCPGTIDHSHQLTFHVDNTPSNWNPYVPLNYSLVDQKQFFKRYENEDIDEIVKIVLNYDKPDWPYFKDDVEYAELAIEEQPLTQVQVRYQNVCQHSTTLLIELMPWALLVNTIGCSIAIIVNEKELCRVSHFGLITPPKLEETFYIGVGIQSTWNMSQPLQLAKSNWTQTFYMPQITGTIPMEGNVKTVVACDPYVCIASIVSTVLNEIRLLKVCSSHVITSHLKIQIQVMCFAIPEFQKDIPFPKNIDGHAFALSPKMYKSNTGISITQWYVLGRVTEDVTNYALYVSFATNARGDFGWSCPTRVDKPFTRRSVAVRTEHQSVPILIVGQEYKGQIYLSVHHDMHPQLLIDNQSGTKLYCAQANSDQSAMSDSEHFNWLCGIKDETSSYYSMPGLYEKFPEILQNSYADSLVITADPASDPQGSAWSSSINITSSNDQFVRVPHYGDVKVSIKFTAHTTRVTIESVSQVQISARDIRVRLSQHEFHSSKPRISSYDEGRVSSQTTIASLYYTAADSTCGPSEFTSRYPRVDLLPERQSRSNQTDVSAIFSAVNMLLFIKSITFTLTSDMECSSGEKIEVLGTCIDNFSVTVAGSEVYKVTICMTDIQVDNQLYGKCPYDFPVLFVGQEIRHKTELHYFNIPIEQIITFSQGNSILRIEMNAETWWDTVLRQYMTDVSDVKVSMQPISVFIEDTFILRLHEYLSDLLPTNLVSWSEKRIVKRKFGAVTIHIPDHIICGSVIYSKPLALRSLVIENVSILLSIHSSIKIYIALDQSPLQFGRFEKKWLLTTNYRLGHVLTMHYLSGAIFGAGWVVGSLELLGSPGGLARAMGNGLRDFVTLPYHGLVQGPWAFLIGVSYGSASLMKHITAGTLQSVTKLASSVARNLDRLTMDEEHLRRTEESRRQRPQGVTQGFVQGLTGLGISLLGAVGGIAHHPIQSVMAGGASPKSVAAGVGKGIVGVFTKPLSGAAELLALTGQGLLQGAGWDSLPEPRNRPVANNLHHSPNSMLKYTWKYLSTVTQKEVIFITEATSITNVSNYHPVALILTSDNLIVLDIDEDAPPRAFNLTEITGITSNDPLLLTFKLQDPKAPIKVDEDEVVEMDPASRARVADYVRSTVGMLQLRDSLSDESDFSMSPASTFRARLPIEDAARDNDNLLLFYVNPQLRDYILRLLEVARLEGMQYTFPVLR